MTEAPTETEEPDDRQEIRLALVMNGGVSLCIWMGGVTRELDRTRRGEGAYGELLALTRSTARIDVIAGASAGGINGAVLALAIARGTTVDALRQLWLTSGAIKNLLRDPLERDAPSVLLGDEVLLRRLREGLGVIGQVPEGKIAASDDAPLHLTITGTGLTGQVKDYADHFGAVIPDVDHRVRFTFRRGRVGEVPAGDGELHWPDDFAPDPDAPGDEAAERLALAGRCSASFPAAFEPSWCPVGARADAEHPDMRPVVNIGVPRWLIDGGVLVNTPFRPALDAIASLPASGPVRRVVGYVVPHPVPPPQERDERTTMPSPLQIVLDAMNRLPRVQSVGRELEEIEANNRRVQRRRSARRCTLRGVRADALAESAKVFLETYRCTRRQLAADDIVDLLLQGRRDREVAAGERRLPSAAAVGALRAAFADPSMDCPWLPAADLSPDRWSDVRLEPWDWGLAPVEFAANLVLEVLQQAVGLEGLGSRRLQVHELRRDFHDQLLALRRVARVNHDYWRERGMAEDQVAGNADERARALAAGWEPRREELGRIARELAGLLPRASQAVAGLGNVDDPEAPASRLRRLLAPLVEPSDGRPAAAEDSLRRLLALEVVQRSSGAELSGIEQEIELVLMSADANNGFGAPPEPEAKLAGLQLHHFGAFYKASWRANDWMWGRIDGADRLVRTLLDARRIQRRLRAGATVDALAGEIEAIACGAKDPELAEYLRARWEGSADAVADQLEALSVADDPPAATALGAGHEAVRLRVQLEIIADELPKVAEAVAADRAEGAQRLREGSELLAALPPGRPHTVKQLISAFQGSRIGREQIADEVGSDFFTDVSTRTAAVTGSVLGRGVAGVKPLRPVLATVRGALLALYLLARGVVDSSRTGGFLVALVLGLGGALVSLFLIGVRVPGFLVLLGTTVLIAGFLLGLIRRTPVRLVVVLALFAATVIAYYGVDSWQGRPNWVDPVASVLAVVMLSLSAMALGLVKRHGRPLGHGREGTARTSAV
jgi:patatin-related protein